MNAFQIIKKQMNEFLKEKDELTNKIKKVDKAIEDTVNECRLRGHQYLFVSQRNACSEEDWQVKFACEHCRHEKTETRKPVCENCFSGDISRLESSSKPVVVNSQVLEKEYEAELYRLRVYHCNSCSELTILMVLGD